MRLFLPVESQLQERLLPQLSSAVAAQAELRAQLNDAEARVSAVEDARRQEEAKLQQLQTELTAAHQSRTKEVKP
eukprot:SAG31_NODE_12892_length_908_cov_1.459827_1_plen_75_part_00